MIFLSIILVLISFIPVYAAQKGEIRLEEIVVTATKTEVPVDIVPGRVVVISEDEIKSLITPTTKVDEILQYISGLNTVRGSGVYSLVAQATLRGLSNEQSRTLVLIDGIPINKSDTGEVNFNRININDIERIEIFKGPASSIYGNNAMGGVINIITKRAVKPLSGFISGFYGRYNTYGGDFGLSAKLSKEQGKGFFIKLSGHYLDSDGYVSTPPERRTTYTVKRFVEEFTGNLILGYDFDKNNSIQFKLDYFDDKRGEGLKYFADKGVSRDFDTQLYSIIYKGSKGSLRWSAKAFYQIENYRRVSESLRAGRYTRFDVDSERIDKGFDVNLSWLISDSNVLTSGFDIKEGSVDASDIYKTSPDRADNRGKLRIIGVWIQNEFQLLRDNLIIIPSLRLDHAKFYEGYFESTISPFNRLNGALSSNSWTALSPRLGVKYRFSNEFDAYLSYGRGFRASILDDLCRSGILWGIYKIANPELEPEKIDSFEIGFNLKPLQNLNLSSSLYYSIGKDFLYFVPTGQTLEGRPLYRRENIGRIKSYGAEFDLNFGLSKGIKLFSNYTYSRAYIDEFEKNRNFEGKTLTRTPKHQIKAGITHTNPIVNYSVFGLYKSSQFVYTNEPRGEIGKISGYTTVNAKVWRELLKNMTLTVSVENVFNKRYMESADDRAPGTVALVNLRYDF